MSKTAHGVSRKKRVKKILSLAKGARGQRSKNYRRAKETVQKGLAYATRDRKVRARTFRALWILRINAFLRSRGLKYSDFIGQLNKKKVLLSRNILADLAVQEPDIFDKLITFIKS